MNIKLIKILFILFFFSIHHILANDTESTENSTLKKRPATIVVNNASPKRTCISSPTQETPEELEELRQKADDGNEDAQVEVAQSYFQQKDIKNASHYFKLAADQGNAYAKYHFVICYSITDEIQFNTNEAVQYLESIATQENPMSHKIQCILGKFYRNNNNIKESLTDAFKFHASTKNFKDAEAQHSCGFYYQKNDDFSKAFDCFRSAADQGHVQAQYEVANLYRNGHGTRINIFRAMQYYELAAKKSHVQSQISLGLYCEDRGEYIRAYEWLLKAAKQNHPLAIAKLTNSDDNPPTYKTWFAQNIKPSNSTAATIALPHIFQNIKKPAAFSIKHRKFLNLVGSLGFNSIDNPKWRILDLTV